MRKTSKLLALLALGALTYYIVKRQLMIPHTRLGALHIEREAQDLPLRFFAIGDTGSGDAEQMAVAAAMEKRCQASPRLDGLLLLGDLFYMRGIGSTTDQQWVDKIEKPYGSPCLKQVDRFPIFGNHDYVGNREAFVEYSRTHERWKMPHRFYSVKFGDLLKFVAIDSNFADFCFMPEHCVVDFLLHELDAATQWKVVMAHHPLASASKKKYSYNGSNLFGLFFRWASCDSADIWLAGHAHHMEHRKREDCASQIFVSGGGGGELEEVEKSTESKFASSEHGFLELEVYREHILARFWDKNSKLVYETTLLPPST